MKLFHLLIIFVCSIQSSIAQTHNEVWVKYNFYTTINAKFSVSVDLNYRQQANIFSNNKNIFSLPLMRSSKLWLFYNLPKKFAIVSAGFIGKTYDRTNPDADLTNATEARFAIGLIKKISFKNWRNSNRLLLEKRIIEPEKKSSNSDTRFRLQNTLSIPLKRINTNNTFSCLLTNEVFFKTWHSFTGFDQNRTSIALQWYYHHYELTMGFQKTYQNQNNNSIAKNQLLLGINYTL